MKIYLTIGFRDRISPIIINKVVNLVNSMDKKAKEDEMKDNVLNHSQEVPEITLKCG